MRMVQLFLAKTNQVALSLPFSVLTEFPVGDSNLRSPAAWPHPQALHRLRLILRMSLRHFLPTVSQFFWRMQERDVDYLLSLSRRRSGNEENSTRSGRLHIA